MTGTDLYKRTHKSVPVIFEPPCIIKWDLKNSWNTGIERLNTRS